MKITFYSTFLNHHQLPFCLEMYKILGDNFKYVATDKIPEERINLGYEDMNTKYKFVIRSYENEYDAYKLAYDSDVVIIGSAPKRYIKERLKKNIGITFLYSERLFKKKSIFNFLKIFYYKFYKENCMNDKYFLLCASAFAANDYKKCGFFKDKAFKWGYFPKVEKYNNINYLVKEKNKKSILWVGRFIKWKHPEAVIQLAKELKKDNADFTIDMIGTGELKNEIEKLIKESGLTNIVKIKGAMSPNEVRKNMEKSSIFIFTSDRGEGWGAVLNEAMNSACAVVASHSIGAVPFLIEENRNGFIYQEGNSLDLYEKVKYLLENEKICKDLGIEAYKTIRNTWNSEVAAKRILELSKSIMSNKENSYTEGPCSKSIELNDNWYN